MKNSKKIVWITGASSGIGKALAVRFSELGHTCALTARNEQLLNELASSANNLFSYPADINDIDKMKETYQEIVNKHGQVDILIANAGTCVYSWPENFNSKEYIDLMDTN